MVVVVVVVSKKTLGKIKNRTENTENGVSIFARVSCDRFLTAVFNHITLQFGAIVTYILTEFGPTLP